MANEFEFVQEKTKAESSPLALSFGLCREDCLPRLQQTSLLAREKESSTEAFFSGLADGAYRQPIRAIQQIAGNSEALKPEMEPESEHQSRKVGQIIGSLVPFAALGIVTKGASNRMFGAEATPTLWRTVGEQAATGFLLGSVLTPSELKPGESLLGSRLTHGAGSALTFAAMGGSAHYLDSALPQFGKSALSNVGRRFTIAAGSGAAGGLVDAEVRSGFKASASELATSALGYAAFGVLMEGGGMAARSILKNAQDNGPAITEILSRQHEARLKQAPAAAALERAVRGEIEAPGSDKLASSLSSASTREPALSPEGSSVGRSDIKAGEQPLPRELNGTKDLINELSLLEKQAGQAPTGNTPADARLQKVLQAVEQKSALLETKLDKVAPKTTGDKTWEPDPRLKLLSKEDLPYAREQLLEELKTFQGGGDAHRFKLYRQLMNMNWMSDAQKIRLTDVVCQVRDYYAHLNTADNPMAFKAQRSWALSQASIAEIINNAIIETKAGVKPDAKVLEEKILLQLFTQFRMHENIPYPEMSAPRMHADRQSAARTILNKVGYPKEQITRITDALRNESLVAQPLDLVKYDAERLKAFEPSNRENLLKRDPKLSSEGPIQEHWKNPNSTETVHADGTRTSRWSNEKGDFELVRKENGLSIAVDHQNDRRFVYGADGKIQSASNVDQRSFFYNKAGTLDRVESADLGKLYRSSKGDWFKELGVDKDGTPNIEYFWKGKIVADDNGAIRLLKPDASEVRVFELNGTEVWHPELGRPEIKSANYAHELGVLKDRIATVFTDAGRQQRMDGLIASFEKEAGARGLDNVEKALFYKQLNRMLVPDSKGMELPLISRRDLAEQATNHAAFPTTIDQGGNSTCNVTTIENRIYTRSPKEIARMLADLSETGTYTTHSGARVDMKNSLTGLRPDAEAREALKIQGEGKVDVKVDGDRDWASQLAQTVMAKIKHLKTSEFVAKDTLVEGGSLIFDKNATLIGKVKEGDVQALLDHTGSKIKALNGEQPVFRKVDGLLQQVDPAHIVYDMTGELAGGITPKTKVLKLYDYFGNQTKELVPGSNYFDEKGKLVMYQTAPGEITYDKLPTDKPGTAFKPSDDTERLTARHLGKKVFLKEIGADGKASTIDSPLLSTPFYRDIAHEVTGTETSAFSIALGPAHKTFHSTIRITNEAEFAAELLKMKESGNLPGILRVHTRNWPFNHRRGGWHVVNIQGYDPVAATLEFTNQWGAKNDFVGDKAVPIAKMFKAMAEPKEPPPPPKDPPPKPVLKPKT